MGRGLLVALLFLTLVALLGGGARAGDTSMPECRFGLAKGTGAHALTFSTRCEFEQRDIAVRPSRRVTGLDRTPSLSGAVDPEDRIECSRGHRPSRVACRGRAGEDARVEGVLTVRGRPCEATVRVDVFGGIDCEPGQVCAQIGYIAASEPLSPRGC